MVVLAIHTPRPMPVFGGGNRFNLAKVRAIRGATTVGRARAEQLKNPLQKNAPALAKSWATTGRVSSPQPKLSTKLKPGAQLTIDGVNDPNEAIPKVRQFIAEQLGRDASKLDVTRGPGRNRDPVYLVRDGQDAVGVLKVFVDPALADAEVKLLGQLNKVRGLRPVEVRGTAEVTWNGKAQRAVFMEMVDRNSAGRQLTQLPTSGSQRVVGLKKIEKDIALIAVGLGRFHKQFETGREYPLTVKDEIRTTWDNVAGSPPTKYHQARDKWPNLTKEMSALLDRFTGELFPLFQKAKLPETAFHGDATAYNFSVGSAGRARVYDVGTMRQGFGPDGLPNATAVFDIGRYMQSLASLTRADGQIALNAGEVKRLQTAFLKGYRRTGTLRKDMEQAIRFTRAEFELAVIRFSKSEPEARGAMQRLKAILDEK